MKRKATQIVVPIVGAEGVDVEKLTNEHNCLMKDLNELLENGWKIFSTHTINNNLTTYLVYVLVKLEIEKTRGE